MCEETVSVWGGTVRVCVGTVSVSGGMVSVEAGQQVVGQKSERTIAGTTR